MAVAMLYVTHPDEQSAEEMCSVPLEEGLIACANIFSISSMYHWETKMNKDSEFVSLLKTSGHMVEHAEGRIMELDGYETPCVIHIEASANQAYEEWVNEQCGGGA